MAVLRTSPCLAQCGCRPSAVSSPLLSVIIVNYRRWQETAALVEQLTTTDAYFRDSIEIIVVDNASPPHPLEAQIKSHKAVIYQRLPCNRGFSAGVNAGFNRSHGDWVLVLNPDLIVCPGFIDLTCSAAIELEDEPVENQPVGVVGFQLRNRDGSRQFSTGVFPDLSRMILGLLKSRSIRKYELVDTADRRPVAWVTGSCLLVRRSCLEQLRGFDEDFFLYYEDVDLCRRARENGWAVCYEPGVEAVHLDPLQNRPLTAPLRAITRHASLTYFRKHLPRWQFLALSRIIRAEAWLLEKWARWTGKRSEAAIARQIQWICRDLAGDRTRQARRRLEAVLRLAGMQRPTRNGCPDRVVTRSPAA
ncbi:MAG: glycosyltransferase family 2 protein [Gemmatales bacterium]|nr:glycosyltransferase family 2 protein [Gemmatales bacterium]MDW8388260.1 glycosyltransferase family 2 protein [Gemmatales bacterium]